MSVISMVGQDCVGGIRQRPHHAHLAAFLAYASMRRTRKLAFAEQVEQRQLHPPDQGAKSVQTLGIGK